MNKFCVYLTIYSGNKLPPFYIGSSTVEKIGLGYHGSVSSWQFKNIWLDEIRNNRTLFKTIIIHTSENRLDAFKKEQFFQKKLNVVKNSLYCNQAISGVRFSAGSKISTKGRESISKSRLGTKLSDESKSRISSSLIKIQRLLKQE